MNIILIGFMGTGKTAVAKLLAERLNRKYIEIDDMIEEAENRTISEIFEKDGEPFFRQLEKEMARKVSKMDEAVISTGGGVVLEEENVKMLKSNGKVILLWAEPEVIYERVKNETHRPLLQIPDPMAKIKELLNKRKPYYEKAVDITINTSNLTIEQVVTKILDELKDHL